MKKLIREPFIHFIFLGAAIFLAYHFLSARADNQPGKIVITQGADHVDGDRLLSHVATSTYS